MLLRKQNVKAVLLYPNRKIERSSEDHGIIKFTFMQSYFFFFTALKFHPINPKAMDRYSLGACAEAGLAINWIVALEIIGLHVMLVESRAQPSEK